MSQQSVFGRNCLVSRNGRILGVLSGARIQLADFQRKTIELVNWADTHNLGLWVGVRPAPSDYPSGDWLVVAIDVGGPHDDHGLIRRTEALLKDSGVTTLEYDIDRDLIFDLANGMRESDLTTL